MSGFYSATVVMMPPTWCEKCGSPLAGVGERPAPPDFLVQRYCDVCHITYQFVVPRIPASIVEPVATTVPRGPLLDMAEGDA